MFQKVLNKFSGVLSYKRFIIIILIAAIFIVAAVYVYRKTVMNKSAMTHPKMDDAPVSSDGDKTADLYLFYTDWCPHCKKTKPEWEQLKKLYDGNKKVNGYSLNFIDVDCEANPDLANKFNINGYPTIKLVKGNQIIEFDSKPDVKTLETFLSTVLAN
jgi:thiol-disulfide isomerase/thioredoxin